VAHQAHHHPVKPNPGGKRRVGAIHPPRPAPTGAGTTWFGSFAGSCDGPGLWTSINPAPGYTTSDGAVNDCVADPLGSGQQVLEMRVTPQTCAWSCEQRLDWDSTHFIQPGSSQFISIPILIPVNGLPCHIGSSANTLDMFNEQFGSPTSGSPSNGLNAYENPSGCTVFGFGGNTSGHSGGGQTLWRGGAAADGHWHDFVEHVVFSTSPQTGEVQLWQDGQQVTFSCTDSSTLTGCGTSTLHYPTLISGATDQSANWVQVNNYRNNSGASYTSTYFHGSPAAGPSYQSVENTIVNAPYGP
jgi:hypothetical protein